MHQRIVRRLRGRVEPAVAEKLAKTCRAFQGALKLSAVVTEHRAAVARAVKKLEATVEAYEKMLGPHGAEIYGLPTPDTPPERGTLDLMRRDLGVLREQVKAWRASGRPTEPGVSGLVRALLGILNAHEVPDRQHQSIIELCFDEMGHSANVKGYLYRARRAGRR